MKPWERNFWTALLVVIVLLVVWQDFHNWRDEPVTWSEQQKQAWQAR